MDNDTPLALLDDIREYSEARREALVATTSEDIDVTTFGPVHIYWGMNRAFDVVAIEVDG